METKAILNMTILEDWFERVLIRKINSIWSYVKKITGGLDTRNIGESVVLSFPYFWVGIVIEQCWQMHVMNARYDVFQRISYNINNTWLCITVQRDP